MPTLDLFTRSPADPDSSHGIRSPGGYEVWHFDAEDASTGLRVVATLSEGSIVHPGYLRRYARYRRSPTRCAPPLPRDYCCAALTVYEEGSMAAQFISQAFRDEVKRSPRPPQVRIGASHLACNPDGSMQLLLRGTPWKRSWHGPALL